VLVYDGEGYPYIYTYASTNLTTDLPYRFKLYSLNINGASPASTVAVIYSCLIPSNVSTPYMISTSTTSIMIGWTEPSANGCPIIGFAIFRDTGSNDAITLEVDQALVRYKPSLR
jgi:hypothetical protein